jgi:hypothetical protein
MDHKQGWESLDWTHLAKVMDKWQSLLKIEMNLGVV